MSPVLVLPYPFTTMVATLLLDSTTHNGKPEFLGVGNPEEWTQYMYQAKVKNIVKEQGQYQYLYHLLPRGATPWFQKTTKKTRELPIETSTLL